MNEIVQEPIDIVKYSLGNKVYIQCKNNRELFGRLHAYDEHLNLLISDVEERIYDNQKVNAKTKRYGCIFVRGDLVIMIAPK